MRGGGSFSMDELQMLRDLPAVANVSKDRITYSNAFKQVCVIRYLAGESPTKIFREAGLPPELIGYKRIERSVARWKAAVLKSVSGSSDMSNGEIITELVNLYVHAVTRKEKLDGIAGIANSDKTNIGNAPHPLDRANVSGGGGCISADVPVPSDAAAIAVPPTPLSASSGLDSETALVIIKQQARRIDELERENESLRGKLKTLAS
ncbi:SlyX family protein [Bifidobacterium adolescentis]|nr:SlyX family protein [Bifidobacterium adolescentis]